MNKSNKTIIAHITGFLEYCEVEKGLAVKTQENYSRFLNKFATWLTDNKLAKLLPHQLTEKHIWDYRFFLSRNKDYRTHKDLKKTTQNYYLIALRALLDYFGVKDIESLAPNKIRLPKLTDRDKQIKFLNLGQVERLLSQPDLTTASGIRDRVILEALFSTGLRVAELVSLNIDQFDFGVLEKLIKKDLSFELNIIGKGGRSRTVYFSPRCIYWLVKYFNHRKDSNPYLFINHKSKTRSPLTVRSVDRIVVKYNKMSGLPVAATPHTLRHSFATDLLSRGAGLRDVQEFLGHKNITTTQIYTHVTNKQLRDVYEKFHGGNKMKD